MQLVQTQERGLPLNLHHEMLPQASLPGFCWI